MTVSAVPEPVVDIQARIAMVESRFGVRRPGAVRSASGSAGSIDFETLLARLTETSGSGRNASALSALAGRLGGPALPAVFGGGVPGPVGSGVLGSGSGADVVNQALEHLGTPYVWGGESPGGFDCSGLIQYSYRQLGVELPRTSAEQARVGRPVASLAEARPGDLIAFNSPVDHIGIYAGDGRMVVAPKRGDVVKVQSIYAQPTAIRRVLADPVGGM